MTELKLCLATVTTDAFLSGTLVMAHSFLKHNRWFEGDIVIISNQLQPNTQETLKTAFKRVHILSISHELQSRLRSLLKFRPGLQNRVARFYSIELFRLSGYDKVLFCDSDLLFLRSIESLFTSAHPLLCVGDGAYYRGNGRHSCTFQEMSLSKHPAGEVLSSTFNAGLLLIGSELLNDNNYAALLALLEIDHWNRIEADHTDQVLYNLHFAGKQHLVESTYNLLLAHRQRIYASDGVNINDAHVLHFNGPAKPWDTPRTIAWTQHDAANIQALNYWYDGYIQCLKDLHLRSNLLGRLG